MKKSAVVIVILIAVLLSGAVLPAFAQTTTYSGTISAGTLLTGGRPDNDSSGCSAQSGGIHYYDLQQIQVPTSGTWVYADSSYGSGGIDLWVTFYSGTFDPTDPLGGGCLANFDDAGAITLTAGVTYTVMISTNPSSTVGTYRFELTNDAPTTGTLVSGPTLTPGRPNSHSVGTCSPADSGTFYYQVSPFTPSVSGDYVYLDEGYKFSLGLDMEIAVYTGAFDPTDPTGNGCFANFDDIGVVHLDAGVTYTILVTNHNSGQTGTFYYLFLGPGAATTAGTCRFPLPTNSVVLSIPNGAPTYWAPDLQDGTGFDLPAGTWWISASSGDFLQVWIACQADPVWVPSASVAGSFTATSASSSVTGGVVKGSGDCPYQLPSSAAVRSIPNGAPAYWSPSLADGANFNLPAGTWWITTTSGDFSQVWISCQADPVWVLSSAVAP